MTKWISTTPTSPWTTRAAISQDGDHPLQIEGLRQRVRGFGGCFNELGMVALEELSGSDRKRVLDQLFLPQGCNFNFCRIPIGASDFACRWYSHNEVDGDFSMSHFSIENDRRYLLPYIKEAIVRNPDMQFFASPWSPPTWLKFPSVYNFGTLIWEKPYLTAYAQYFVKFIQAYQEEGIPIHQLHIQNEPCSTQKFPSCEWTGEQFREFIGEYLVPLFHEKQIKTDIWLGTINGPEVDDRKLRTRFNDYANVVMEDPICQTEVKGVSYQWAGKYAVQSTHDAWPDLELIQSESECGDGTNSWDYARYIFEMIWHYFRNGVSSYVYWNMVLKEGGQSTWGWRQNSMITVVNQKVVYQPEFYLMKHFSHFVQPGAHVLRLTGPWSANTVGFENLDKTQVFVLMNPFQQEKCVTMRGTTYHLLPLSFNTIVLDPM